MSKGQITAAERRLRNLKKSRERLEPKEIHLDRKSANELARRLEEAKRRVGVWVYPDGDPPGWNESMRYRSGLGIADRMNERKLRDRMWRAAGVEPKRVVDSGKTEPPTAPTVDDP